jgi:endonuclease III
MKKTAIKLKAAERISGILNSLYPDPPIPLKHKDNFTLLIAVLLSAQCTDKRVNEVTPKLFELASNPLKMSKLDPLLVESIIKPCGLAPKKSKAIVELSKIILAKHDGKVPCSLEELEELPGVGHKTASVVMCQAFGKPAFPVDTHIHRLAERWKLSNGKSVVQTERDLKAIFPIEIWHKLHLQMIYFGREYCPARGHDIKSCPICSLI